MIVKGNQRGGARALAAHLLNLFDNDHVEVHGIDGCIATDVTGAFVEIEAISRTTRCKQPFFSVSISPPKGETVVTVDFENAIAQVAEATGLGQQPRVVLFHEKEARRHCHAVFSRIDATNLKAINLPFFKNRLAEVSRELYLTHGFDLPKGLADKSLADPLNFSLEEWQVAKRAKRNPREIKAALKQCWAQSDNGPAFAAALKERGFWLCRGDRRGFVALDYKGNVFSLSRWLDVKTKELKACLSSLQQLETSKNLVLGGLQLASAAETRIEIETAITGAAQRLRDDLERKHAEAIQPLLVERQRVAERQRQERAALATAQRSRQEARALDHAQRFRHGLKGLWDWVTGRRRDIKHAIEVETQLAKKTGDLELNKLCELHIRETSMLQHRIDGVMLRRQIDQRTLDNLCPTTTLYGEDKGRLYNQRTDSSSNQETTPYQV